MPEESSEQPPERTGATINRVVGDPANAVQARDVGSINFGANADNDVEVVLQPEQPEVVVGPGRECTVIPLTVSSHLAEPVTVKLSLRGAPTPQWAVEPGEVTVHRDAPESAAIRLPCTATEPSAGPKHLRVVAKHRDGRTWPSDPSITVTVRPKPGLAVETTGAPDVRGGEQTIPLTVRNTGNTRLRGSLKRRTAPEGEAGYLPREAIAPPQGGTPPFELNPGEAVERLVVVTLPPPEMTERKWKLPIAAWLEGAEEPCTVPELTVTQPGWLSEIPGHLQRLSSWSRVKHGPYRRGTLAIWGVAVFIAGLLFGANVFYSPPAAVSAPPSNETATTPSVPPRFAPVPREPMPCTPGNAVVYLASMTKPEADEYAAYFVQREYSRMKALEIPADRRYAIHVTDRADLCPVLRRDLDGNPKMANFSAFIWIGAPANEAAGICANLALPRNFDCVVKPVT